MCEKRQPILCLSTQDYDDLWTRKQRFMNYFADLGHPVIYVEAQWHWLTWFKRGRSQPGRAWRFLHRPRKIKDNLHVVTPPLLIPFFQMFASLALINNVIVGVWLKWTLRRMGLREPLVYSYVPYSHLAIKIIGAKKALYEKVDDLAAAQGLVRRTTVERLESKLLQMTKVVIVTAGRLKELLRDKHENVHVIPNACEIAHFGRRGSATASIVDTIPRPRIGFVGMLSYWIDCDLICRLAASEPNWQFVFIGPTAIDTTALRRFANVHFVGRVPYGVLPDAMAQIDVFINPYKNDAIAASCSPLKVFEYLAAGKPVVSVPMPEVMRFSPDIRIATTPGEFRTAITTLLSLAPAERLKLSDRLRELVRNDTWENRFAQTRRVIEETFAP